MIPQHARYFERILLSERARSVESLHRLEVVEAEPQAMSAGDTVRGLKSPADAASETLQEETDFAEVTRLSDHLAEVDAALLRVRERPEAYDVCADCGERIHPWRLHLLPWVTTCGTCAGCFAEDWER